MIEFNPDGSLKLPDNILKKKSQDEQRMKNTRCMKVQRDVVSAVTPKKCILHIRLSDAMTDNRFVDTIYKEFRQYAQTPTKMTLVDERNIDVEIGSDFKRCSDCTSLIGKYREFLDGNFIEEKGRCTFEGRQFSYEDYFD